MNYHRPLTEEVPKEIRLQVYKKALELIENWKLNPTPKRGNLILPELCLLLPVILYEESDFRDKSKVNWWFTQTELAFPELSNQFFEEIKQQRHQIEKTEVRKKYLKEFIKQLENQSIKTQQKQ